MHKLIIFSIVLVIVISLPAQQKQPSSSEHALKLTIEPGIGFHLVGNPMIQLSNLSQFQLKKRIALLAHSAYSYKFKNSKVSDVKQNYSYAIAQKFGLGITFYSKKTTHIVSFLAGLRYDAYSGTLKNTDIQESITTKSSSTKPDYGCMYNSKIGFNKLFLSQRIYIPFSNGLYGISERTTFEIGIGLRLK